jgi:hypothetical protein
MDHKWDLKAMHPYRDVFHETEFVAISLVAFRYFIVSGKIDQARDLYAMFSLKPRHRAIQGDVTARSYLEHSPLAHGGTEVLKKKETFLDVALEEMQHLSLVNWFLVELGAAPNFMPHTFPFSSDLYPFEIELRSLDRYVVATSLWVEADQCKLSLSPHCRKSSEKPKFVKRVRRVLRKGSAKYRKTPIDEEKLNHVGSLYHKIIQWTRRVAKKPPGFLPADFPWAEWEARMNWIIYQGEDTHYCFFRRLFTGKAFGSQGSAIWKPGPDFPAYAFTPQTAYAGRPNTIPGANVRRLAWLADLHYWIILCLLDVAYRSNTRKMAYKAIDNMTLGLWFLGRHLADRYQTGIPFDQLGPHYCLGRSDLWSVNILRLLVQEASQKARELENDNLLPAGYTLQLFDVTLAGLDSLSKAGPPPAFSESRFA